MNSLRPLVAPLTKTLTHCVHTVVATLPHLRPGLCLAQATCCKEQPDEAGPSDVHSILASIFNQSIS